MSLIRAIFGGLRVIFGLFCNFGAIKAPWRGKRMGEAGPSGLERGALCCNFWENSKGPGERQNSYPLPLGVTPRA